MNYKPLWGVVEDVSVSHFEVEEDKYELDDIDDGEPNKVLYSVRRIVNRNV